MTRVPRVLVCGVLVAVLGLPATAWAQDPPPAGQSPARGQRGAGRGAMPPATANMNQQQLQAWLDTYAVIQAQRQLVLTDEQYPAFVARLRKLQDVRRRRMVERRRLLNELSGLIQSTAANRDENILARIRALDEGADSGAAELRKAYVDLDAVLTPWQRGRFRLFEEQLERQKIDLIAQTKITGVG